jgi:hypothetical protein
MAQKLNTFVAANENLPPEIESVIRFFDAVLNEEFPAIKAPKVDNEILHIAIGLYEASIKHSSNMTLEKVQDLEPQLAAKISMLEKLKGEGFSEELQQVMIASNCFFETFSEHLSAKISQEQPSNIASQALAKPASEKSSPNRSY